MKHKLLVFAVILLAVFTSVAPVSAQSSRRGHTHQAKPAAVSAQADIYEIVLQYSESTMGLLDLKFDSNEVAKFMANQAFKVNQLLGKTDNNSAPVTADQKKAVAEAAYGFIEGAAGWYAGAQGVSIDDPSVQEMLAPIHDKIFGAVESASTLGELRAALRAVGSTGL